MTGAAFDSRVMRLNMWRVAAPTSIRPLPTVVDRFSPASHCERLFQENRDVSLEAAAATNGVTATCHGRATVTPCRTETAEIQLSGSAAVMYPEDAYAWPGKESGRSRMCAPGPFTVQAFQ